MYGEFGKPITVDISKFSVVTPIFYFTFIWKLGSGNLMVVLLFLSDFWKWVIFGPKVLFLYFVTVL